jgi:hypothetical protein
LYFSVVISLFRGKAMQLYMFAYYLLSQSGDQGGQAVIVSASLHLLAADLHRGLTTTSLAVHTVSIGTVRQPVQVPSLCLVTDSLSVFRQAVLVSPC